MMPELDNFTTMQSHPLAAEGGATCNETFTKSAFLPYPVGTGYRLTQAADTIAASLRQIRLPCRRLIRG
jgi:hypothetical protein